MKPHISFKTQHKQSSQLQASPTVPWTTPGASQVFQAAGSQRQASALQIHHLSLSLLPSGKSVSTTKEEDEVEKKGGMEAERDSGVGGEGGN